MYGLVTIGRGIKHVLYFDKRSQLLFSMLTVVCEMPRLLKIETFSASKLFALSKQVPHPICLIGIDLISPFRIPGKKKAEVQWFYLLFLICAILKMIMESKRIKFLCSNFVYDIKFLPFIQSVGRTTAFQIFHKSWLQSVSWNLSQQKWWHFQHLG